MFTMMNRTRLAVGLQGVAIAELATQQALTYARDRKQGAAGAIIAYPDVKRMLLTMRALTGAARAICYATAVAIDRSQRGKTEAARKAGDQRASLLTPVAKAFSTDIGIEVASLGVQVHGGMGFIEETGAAQHYRDARIAAIYEGTNGIQAIDLVMRKLPMRHGGVVADLLARMESLDPELAAAGPELAGVRSALTSGVSALREATTWLGAKLPAEPNDVLAGATPYLRLCGLVIGGWLLARSALAASGLLRDASGSDAVFLQDKIATARFYAEQLLPQAAGLLPAVTSGAGQLFDVDLSKATLG
jgi:hypothetical protein